MAAAASPARSALPPSAPREGAYREAGVVQHASLRAQRYRLHGIGKVTGEVDVGDLVVEGGLSIGGALIADRVDLRGTIDVAGDTRIAGAARVEGTLRSAGGWTAGALRSKGSFHVERALAVDEILEARGTIEVGGDARVGLFRPDARVVVGGTLTARAIDGRFDGESRIRQILAGTARLAPRQFVRLPVEVPFLRPRAALTVERLEATRVELEGVTVHYLRAPEIVLGRHCHVATFEGTIVRRDPSSHVGFESRSPPPPGLMR